MTNYEFGDLWVSLMIILFSSSRLDFPVFSHYPEILVQLGLVINSERPRNSLTVSQTAYISHTSERFEITSD